ncbi:MAG: hypothetical protein J5770_02405 [Bacteroidaceae bacterium]|nr:hypothetical protein [Bacteroidaceae bacterium]
MIVETYIKNRDWDGLSHHLGSVSNAEFRRLQTVMREKVMPHLANETFWETYLHLLMFRRQAFLPCVLAAEGLAKAGSLDFDCQEAREVAAWMQASSPESVVKVIRMMVPFLTSVRQIEGLFRLFEWDDERECALVLVKESTPYAYYVLFNVLRRAADNRQLLVAACQAIMKKNDDMSFNMASLLRSYFDLHEIKSTFSLQIEPYELSYIEQSYENFEHILKGKRPKL